MSEAKFTKGEWIQQTGQHMSGEGYRIGKVFVGSAYYSALTSRDDPLRYRCRIDLPGMKQPQEAYTTIDEAKARLERAVATWFRWVEEEPAARSALAKARGRG